MKNALIRYVVGAALAAATIFGAAPERAAAQSACPYIAYGAVLTAAQWNACFSAKQDVLGYVPVNKAGDVMLGRLTMLSSTPTSSGLNLPQGSAPTNPANGDVWTTLAGMFVRINGFTVGPLAGANSTSFAATAPLAVSFPGGIVTYALNIDPNFAVVSTNLAFASIASGNLIANSTGGAAEPTSSTLTALIDRALGSTRGSVLERGASAWAPITPGTTAFPFVSNGAGADPAYQQLTGAGIAANTVALSNIVQVAANTMLGNWTGSPATVAANAMPSCPDSGGNHLNYVSGSGVTCGTGFGNGITALTGDGTATGPGSAVLTLATVNTNVGSFGTATQAPQFTVNGKGLITAATNVTVTPAVGSITGLGTGVATALGTNIGTAGSFVVDGGALGTPSSGVATNLTGTASGLTAGAVPASGITGTTLSSSVITSSLTTVGALGAGSATTGFSIAGASVTWSSQIAGANVVPVANASGSPSATFGVMKADGTTIQCSAGTCSAVGGVATSVTVGTTTVGSASGSNQVLTTGTVVAGTGTLANVATTALTFGTGTLSLSGNLSTTGAFNPTFAIPASVTYTFPGSAATLASLNIAGQTLTGGAIVTGNSIGTPTNGSTVTVNCGTSPIQWLTNNVAGFTIAAPASDSSCFIQITNGASAGAVTFSGFTVNSTYTGGALDTTNGHKFMVFVARGNGSAIYNIVPQQ